MPNLSFYCLDAKTEFVLRDFKPDPELKVLCGSSQIQVGKLGGVSALVVLSGGEKALFVTERDGRRS